MSQLEELTPFPVEPFFYIWPKRCLSSGTSAGSLQCRFIHEEIWSHICYRSQCWVCFHNKQLSHFSRRELITFPAHALHTQCEFLFLIRRKGSIVELGYQSQRLTDINQGNENTLAVAIVHTFLWASEILMVRHAKVNIYTTLEKQQRLSKIHWV